MATNFITRTTFFVKGFTLIVLLVTISIIAVLSVVGFTSFTQVREKAWDAKKKADIDAIRKAYEQNFDPTENNGQGGYKALNDNQFASGKIPTPPEGGDYTRIKNTATTGFTICASLSGSTPCAALSDTCYCQSSAQAEAPTLIAANTEFLTNASSFSPEPSQAPSQPALSQPGSESGVSSPVTYEVKTWLITYKEIAGRSVNISGLTPADFTKQILLPAMIEASRYHGYFNPSAQPALRYTLSDTDIYIEDNPRPARYSDLFNKYNLCNYAKANDIKTVIIWADSDYNYGSGEIRRESAITGNKGILTNGPILTSVCDKTIVIYGLTYTRGLSEALESYGHHLETVFRQFRPEYAFWADEAQKTGWFPAVTRGDSCGTDHEPPNARWEYDRSNDADYQSDCRNWKPDGTGVKETLNCNTWGCSGEGWLKWWMQNMPGLGNTLVGTNGQKIPNWWVYIGDPDNCYNNALGCSGFTPNPTPTPAPPVFSNLSAQLTNSSATFNFAYSKPSETLYKIHLSKSTAFSWGVWWNFVNGSASPLINTAPSATWSDYSCNQQFYWKVEAIYTGNYLSSAQGPVTVSCN